MFCVFIFRFVFAGQGIDPEMCIHTHTQGGKLLTLKLMRCELNDWGCKCLCDFLHDTEKEILEVALKGSCLTTAMQSEVEAQAKLLNYFLGSNKSNINQTQHRHILTGLSRQVRHPHLEEEHDEVNTTVEVGVEVGLGGVKLGMVPREELGEDK